jgi:hypothetical protein
MRYNIRKTTLTTARLSIESSESIDPTRKPQIMRFYPGDTRPARMSTGAVLGREPGKTCALIAHVRPLDLIGVREKILQVDKYSWRYFRINNHFHPISLSLPNRGLSLEECVALLSVKDTIELDQIDFTDAGLQSFFAQRHPGWLQAIADRQIDHWRRHKPDKFFRLAPVNFAGRDVSRCVTESPFAALARLQDRLNKTQLSLCLKQCPRAAVMFAFGKIPHHQRNSYLSDYPREALLFAADKLSDAELALSAKFDMFTAFRCRTIMTPERHAILLAHSYLIAFSVISGGSVARLHAEIRASIISFPKLWRDSDPGGFPSIFSSLMDHLNMDLDPMVVNALLEKTEAGDQQDIANLITQRI